MSTRKALLIALTVTAIVLAVGIGFRFTKTANALSAAKAPGPDATIPYTGRLEGEAGQPVADGMYYFTFALYKTPSGGEPLWTETQEGVEVKGGAFTTLLGSVKKIPTGVLLTSGGGWLEVSVRGPKESSFTTLSPRLQLNAASPTSPASITSGPVCPHDHWGEAWEGTGIGLDLHTPGGGSTAQLISLLSAVYGYHDVFYGVLGKSNSNGIGVGGDSKNRYGVWGHSTNSYGGWFESNNDHLDLALGGHVGRINTDPTDQNSQLYLSSNADIILKLDNDGGENQTLRVKNSGGNDACTISEGGDLHCAGTKNAVVNTASYGQRLLYSVESPEVWFEDFGTASLVNGKATVAFDSVFAETVNLNEDYHVFLTPIAGEPVMLFVTAKSASSFTVQGVTLDGKPAKASFDYRIVAKRLGYENIRLAPPAGFTSSNGK